jgi:hypothetical protein
VGTSGRVPDGLTGSDHVTTSADMALWVAQLRKSLAELETQDFAYPLRNDVRHPAPNRPVLPEALEPLYAVTDGISLPHAHVGYFIESAEGVAAMPARGEPSRLEGLMAMEIVVFGSDGGGSRFVLRIDDGSVYFLPSSGAMRDRVYPLRAQTGSPGTPGRLRGRLSVAAQGRRRYVRTR